MKNPDLESRRRQCLVSTLVLGLVLLVTGCGGGGGSSDEADESSADNTTTDNNTTTPTVDAEAARAALGKLIFEDTNLSEPAGQSCATCHASVAGFADPDSTQPTSDGANGAIGTRNAPTASYAAHIPEFAEQPPGQFVGGQFIDGRAATLEEQARMPFLSANEMNLLTETEVVSRLRAAAYRDQFLEVFGDGALDNDTSAFTDMVAAIAAFERSDEFSPFSSKFDRVLLGQDTFTAAETRGRNLFNGPAGCNRCHNTRPVDGPQVFSDFRYTNIGVPSNPDLLTALGNPTFVDNGLGDALGETAQDGKFRTPTLRNVAITAPYMHNGVFDTLQEVMDFYNTRPDPPEVTNALENPTNDPGDIGNLGLDSDDINDIIAFMNTLTD